MNIFHAFWKIYGVPCNCILYSSLAQLVERMTVNHDVAGSSPAGGAKKVSPIGTGFFYLFAGH